MLRALPPTVPCSKQSHHRIVGENNKLFFNDAELLKISVHARFAVIWFSAPSLLGTCWLKHFRHGYKYHLLLSHSLHMICLPFSYFAAIFYITNGANLKHEFLDILILKLLFFTLMKAIPISRIPICTTFIFFSFSFEISVCDMTLLNAPIQLSFLYLPLHFTSVRAFVHPPYHHPRLPQVVVPQLVFIWISTPSKLHPQGQQQGLP